MKEWFSAAELAALQLDGLPRSERSIRHFLRYADPDLRLPSARRGGGYVFAPAALPPEAQEALRHEMIAAVLAERRTKLRAAIDLVLAEAGSR